MAMFSDFSLKALIKSWKDKYGMGPNPFVKVSEYTGDFELNFNPEELKECPSAQLQTIGDLTETGSCNVTAMGGTIVYAVDSTKLHHNFYILQVLTVAPNLRSNDPKLVSKIGKHEGSAGHVLMTFPSGGAILTSMGHWIELMKIDASAEKLFEVA